jgi:nucleotide-binding universal stress UspA family protein
MVRTSPAGGQNRRETKAISQKRSLPGAIADRIQTWHRVCQRKDVPPEACNDEVGIMYRSILVPLDGSAFGEQALLVAIHLARRSGASLHLVLVHTAFVHVESGLIYDDRVNRLLREQEQGYLEAVVKRWQAASPVPVTWTLREGLVADGIFEQVAASSADLIVMTTHGRGPLSRFWLGSVADNLVRRASIPVLLLRPQETAPDQAQELIFRHVLIPLDGSALAEQVLEPAVTLGQLLGADLTLLRIVKPVLFAGHDPTVLRDPAVGQPATEQLEAEARAYLAGVAERLRAQALPVQTRVIVNTQPAAAILEQSLEPLGGIIALETHGRGGLTRALLGSVADKVVRGTTIPVLVCRPPRH